MTASRGERIAVAAVWLLVSGVVSYLTWRAGAPIEVMLSSLSITALGWAIALGRLHAHASARLPRMWVRRRPRRRG